MLAYLKGAGINTEKKGNQLRIMPLTDKNVLQISNGEIKDAASALRGKDLATRKNGLFDNDITGGVQGTHWSHIKLAKRIPNPMYADAIMKLLDLTEKRYLGIISGDQELHDKSGVNAILDALKDINVSKEIKRLKADLKIAPITNVDKLNKRVRYLGALNDLDLSPTEAYTTKYIPVLPPVFRPIYPLQTGDLVVSDLNKHYRDLGAINISFTNALKEKAVSPNDLVDAMSALYSSLKALQGFIDPVNYTSEKYKGVLKELHQKRGLIQGRA